MDLAEKFQTNWKNNFNHLSQSNCHLILAVSGGADSVILADLLFKSNFDFSIAHCNFQLRENESDEDEKFVRSVAEKYQKEFFIKKFETKIYVDEHKISIQEAARNLRYEWFKELINFQKANQQSTTSNFLCIAHHADDNIETVLLNFLRGTGLQGLKGIAAFDKRRKIIRPLLFARREEIIVYAKENNLEWREDSSNASDKYTRNFFRHQVIPLIKEKFATADENILNNINHFNEEHLIYEEAIAAIKKKLVEEKGNEIHIPILKLKKQVAFKTIIWEIFKQYNFHASQVDEIIKLLDAENSAFIKNEKYIVLKNRNWLVIAPNESKSSGHILIEGNDKKIIFENGMLTFEKVLTTNFKLQTSNSIATLDADEIQFPLLLRKWKQGDYFYPLGMKKKKKVSKFFIDNKLSKIEKENVWVIEMNKKIIWIVNHRIDERFKVSDSTKNILKILHSTE